MFRNKAQLVIQRCPLFFSCPYMSSLGEPFYSLLLGPLLYIPTKWVLAHVTQHPGLK